MCIPIYFCLFFQGGPWWRLLRRASRNTSVVIAGVFIISKGYYMIDQLAFKG